MKFNNKFFIVIIAVTIIFYSILIMISDLRVIFSEIIHFNLSYLPVILLLISSGWALFFKRWELLLKSIGINIPLKDNLKIFFSGFGVGFTPGRIGELLKSQMLKNMYDIPRKKTAPLIIIERLYDTVGAIVASSIGIVFFPVSWYVIIVPACIVLLVFMISSSRMIFTKFLAKMQKIRILSKSLEPFSDSYETIRTSTRGKVVVLSSLLSIANWLVTSLAVYFVFLAYGIESLNYLQVTSAFTSSSLLGAVSFIPGGIGITEVSLAGFLKLLGIDISTIFVLAILVRIFTLWYGVIVGLIVLKASRGFATHRF